MESQSRGDIEVQVRMMDHVQSPQQWDCVEHHMLQIDHQIKRQHGHNDLCPVWPVDQMQHAPAARLSNDRCGDIRCHQKSHRQTTAAEDRHQEQLRLTPASALHFEEDVALGHANGQQPNILIGTVDGQSPLYVHRLLREYPEANWTIRANDRTTTKLAALNTQVTLAPQEVAIRDRRILEHTSNVGGVRFAGVGMDGLPQEWPVGGG